MPICDWRVPHSPHKFLQRSNDQQSQAVTTPCQCQRLFAENTNGWICSWRDSTYKHASVADTVEESGPSHPSSTSRGSKLSFRRRKVLAYDVIFAHLLGK